MSWDTSCGEADRLQSGPWQACRSLTTSPDRKLSQTAHLSKFKRRARVSLMLANVTHVVSRVGVQPDWNSVVLSHADRARCVW